ncbi:MAG TPA: hypothetical protein VD884_19485 [Ohtaekwangia sp.]|nr:hypothetical protein [Ohtaekwangia sp.]
MKTCIPLLMFFFCTFSVSLYAQENAAQSKNGEINRKRPDTENNNTFRDDSTDAAMGMSGLSATPGTATTSGAGGTGTNENPGYNTSSDIYNIKRRDSIQQAKSDSIQNIKQNRNKNKRQTAK